MAGALPLLCRCIALLVPGSRTCIIRATLFSGVDPPIAKFSPPSRVVVVLHRRFIIPGTIAALGFPDIIMLMSLFYPSRVLVLREVETILFVVTPLLNRLATPVASPSLLNVVRTLLPAPLIMLGTSIGTGFPSSAIAILLPRPTAALGLGSTSSVVFLGPLSEHLLPELLRPTPLKFVPPNVDRGLPLPVEPALRILPGTAITRIFREIAIASRRPRCPSMRSFIIVPPLSIEVEMTPFLVTLLSHRPLVPQGTFVIPSASLHAV